MLLTRLNILQGYQASDSTWPCCVASTRKEIDHMGSYLPIFDQALSVLSGEESTLFHIILKK
jgi:hypothetical protein